MKFIPLSSAPLLNNTFLLFVPIVAWFMGRHHTPHKVWLGIVLGFIGVGLVLKPAPGFFQVASIFGLASGILAVIAVMIIRGLTKLGWKEESMPKWSAQLVSRPKRTLALMIGL